MENEENIITNLLDRYEAFKLKWLQINEQDMFDFLKLQDEIEDKVVELRSSYAEDELLFDRDYWLRLVELKWIKDLDWKKRYTDATAKALCDNEFYEKELDLIVKKATYENLQNKAKKIVEYINIVKLSLRKDFTI